MSERMKHTPVKGYTSTPQWNNLHLADTLSLSLALARSLALPLFPEMAQR